ncbi:MAG: ABC transporter substrate-binding protein [Actinomycetota bacterium]
MTSPSNSAGRRSTAPEVLREAHETPSIDRRGFLTWAARGGASLAAAGAFGSLVAACGSGSDESGDDSGGGDGGGGDGGGSDFSGLGVSTLKVGVIVPTSGVGQFLGDIVQRALGAAKKHITDADLTHGVTIDYVIENAPAEEFADGTTKAYNALIADPEIIGILWCTPYGISEAAPQLRRDGIPVMSVYGDTYSEGNLYPEGDGLRNVFQMLLPDTMSFDALCDYAKNDRKYTSTALIYDKLTLPSAAQQFTTAAEDHGLDIVGIEEFTLFSADYGAQLQRLKSAAPQCLIVWGLSDNTAQIVKGLDALGAAYVDTPTAKGGDTWAPQILGYPGGTGEKKWAELAGDSAKAGTLTAWYLGGLVGGPHFPIRDWLVAYDGNGASGGEEGAPNAWWALLQAAKTAGTTERAAIVDALETMPKIEFAGLPFSFGPENHLGMTRDDVCLITLERYSGPVDTDPPYELGREWTETFPLIDERYVGPAHLIRPTLEANLRAQPEYMQQILAENWGTQCSKEPPDAPGSTVTMTGDCKVH